MTAAWRLHAPLVVIGLVVLPAAALALLALLRRRVGTRRAVAAAVLVVAGTPFPVMMFMPQDAPRSIDLTPLNDVPSWFDDSWLTAAEQLGGNLLALAALGACLPVLVPALAWLPRIALPAAALATGIEIAQWVFDIGRVSSVDDVLVNTLGATLAALASRPWWSTRKRGTESAPMPVA